MAYKQHFIEWFSGKQLPSYWTFSNLSGTGSGAMSDSVDGGYAITTGATSGNSSDINFGDKRLYAHDGSKIIGVWKSASNTSQATIFGFVNTITLANDWAGVITDSLVSAFFWLATTDTTTRSDTASDIAEDTNFHTHEIETGSSNIKLTIDGVLKVTKTTNLPTIKLQPFFWQQTKTTGSKVGHIRYLEAYNT